MDEVACIRVWPRTAIPDRFRHVVSLDEDGGTIAMFLAHVPAMVLADPTYRQCGGVSGTDVWSREGELGLFGTNGLDVHPHPDGDGILIVGVCV